MKLIYRDESRHIAIDYRMAEHYALDAYEASRLVGLDPRYMARMNSDDELARAAGRTFEELAEDALRAKESGA